MTTLTADVIVVGGGPAGIAAVCRLLPAGRRVIWIDAQARPGGQVWRAGPAPAWAKALAALETDPRLQRLAGHAVIGVDGDGEHGRTLLLHNSLEAGAPALRVHAPQLLLALGARERFLPFPGWTLPGVTGAGGLQVLIKGGWPIAGRRVVLAGSGPLLLAAADTARAAGATLGLIAEQAPRAALLGFAARLPAAQLIQAAGLRWRLRGVPYRAGCWIVRAQGATALESLVLTDGRKSWTEPCEALGLGFGLLPNTELAELLGCRLADGAIAVDAGLQSSLPGVFAAGECTGIGGVDKALIEGQLVALQMLGRDDAGLRAAHARALAFAARLRRHFALRPALRQLADAQTPICRCENIAFGALKTQRSGRDARLQTRCGMGAYQGRICGPITQELFGWTPGGPREPLQPAPLACFLNEPPA